MIVLISALAVNLRVAMYSASLTPYLGDAPLWQRACAAYLTVDQAYALSMIEFERRAEWGTRERMAYFFGTNGLVAPAWMAATITGALVGASIPDSMPAPGRFAKQSAKPQCPGVEGHSLVAGDMALHAPLQT
ncbi:AzlC family protein [Ruegeria sp. TrichCH4B]|nr:AzlC family protein [Ruegeria sp. TrichCH4B]